METLRGLENSNLQMINVLMKGKDVAQQLQKHLDPSASPGKFEFFIDQILASYNEAFYLLNFNGGIPDCPNLLAGCSPRITRSSDHEHPPRPPKKRKTMPRRMEMVKASTGRGGEEDLPSDGYSWRKYGQKHIHGTQFRRGYYRCTHQRSQGCFALKQVQRSDKDPTVFHVTYVGNHTCRSSSHPSTSRNLPPVQPKLTDHHRDHPRDENQNLVQVQQDASSTVRPQLKVKTEDLDNGDEENFFRSFSLSTGLLESDAADLAYWLFSASPATSDSNPFASSPAHRNGVWTPESDSYEGVSASNSPIDELKFILDDL